MNRNTIAFNKLSPKQERQFSNVVRETVALWAIDELNWEVVRNLAHRIVWRKRLEIIASEASFLGFSRLTQLCKAMAACLQAGDMLPDRSDASLEALEFGWKTICSAVMAPQSGSVEIIDNAIQILQVAFDRTDGDLQEPIALRAILSFGEPTISTKDSTVEIHKDSNVYDKSKIDALGHCIEEESWIVGQLANVAEDFATGTASVRPAARLMQVFRSHEFFQSVDRVCLVGRVPDANQLVVVDSATSERITKNTLKKGYSCFVNPTGSLFSMQPSTVRVFGECNQVLESFNQQNKPAQRSIALIAEQGLRSGLCMAIGRGNAIQGFLFLNSIDPGLFDSVTDRYAPLLSLFGLLGTLALDSSGFQGSQAPPTLKLSDAIPSHSIRFEKENLSELINSHLTLGLGSPTAVQLEVGENLGEFLYLPRMVVQSVSELLLRMVWNREMLHGIVPVQIHRLGESIVVSIAHLCDQNKIESWTRIRNLVGSLNAHVEHIPVTYRLHDDSVRIEFPYEPTIAGSAGQLYSIVH